MQTHTISQLCRAFDVSTRTLRYYEQIGLITSQRSPDYAYRTYDGQAEARLRQILVLRKLRIPLKQIAEILRSEDAGTAVDVFTRHIGEIDAQMDALSTVRAALEALLTRIRLDGSSRDRLAIPDPELLKVVLRLPDMPGMKEEFRMKDLNQVDKALSKLNDVRILTLPPMTVAASHYVGPDPEGHAMAPLLKLIGDAKLFDIKPEARLLGFNHPNPSPGSASYGYEFWLSIPDDLPLPEPLVRHRFPGGLFAAHMIQMGNFGEWSLLMDWARGNERYQENTLKDGGERMHGLMEEILNLPQLVASGGEPGEHTQLDLLLPIKPR